MTPRASAAVVALVLGLLLASCSGDAPAPEQGTTADQGAAPSPPRTPAAGEYLPGLPATVDLPDGQPEAVVLLVPGGGWSSANPTGERVLVGPLTGAGLAVVTITYGTSETGDFYPRPADDVACAVAYAAEQVPDVPVVLVGHSAGAHLVALVGLRPDRDDAECPYPPHSADAVVGLAGPYDVRRAESIAEEHLFGVPREQDPGLWEDGNPHTWVGERPELPFLLVHGDADTQVPMFFTDTLAADLVEAGHPVTVEVPPDVDHLDILLPEVLTGLLIDWVRAVVIDQT